MMIFSLQKIAKKNKKQAMCFNKFQKMKSRNLNRNQEKEEDLILTFKSQEKVNSLKEKTNN